MMKFCLIQSKFVGKCMGGVVSGVQMYSEDYKIYDERLNRVIVIGEEGFYIQC